MNWSNFVRQSHRWVSIAFTGGVIINMAVIGQGQGQQQPAMWVGLLALLPLILLLLSGLYLFVLPYAAKRRSG